MHPSPEARRGGLTPLGLYLLMASGCGPGAPRGEVEGVVRCNGQPLADVLVTFLPDTDQGGQGPRSSARTDPRGHYRLRGEDRRAGAVAGWHRVVVEDLAVYAAPRDADGTLRRRPPVRLPPRYSNPLQTPLRKEVLPGVQTMDLDLSAAPLDVTRALTPRPGQRATE
jgi:hypothetical protein